MSVGTETVPFMDLRRTHEPLRAELAAAFDRVVGSSAFVLGTEVEAFEAEFAAYCGAAECAGVSSGTSALSLAIRAAGIGPGDEVIVPAHTFIASVLGILHAGATPVFCDVLDDTGLIDPASAAAAVSPRTAGIVAVHLYGQVCDMPALNALGERHGLVVVEDAAQAHGATYAGARAGSLGTVACFSFYPSKNLGALGDGGAVCTSDPALADRVRRLRNLGQARKGEHVELGYNERLDGLQAALLRVKLPHLDAANAARRRHAATYRRLLPSTLRVVAERPQTPSIHHVFAVRVPDRDALAARLAELGVQTGIHYFPAAHEQPPCAGSVTSRVTLNNATAWAGQELSLPMFPQMSDREIELVAACMDAHTSDNHPGGDS